MQLKQRCSFLDSFDINSVFKSETSHPKVKC